MNSRDTTGNSRHSGYARAEHDWYVEPPSAVCALLERETFAGSIHDPACGGGNIPTVCGWYDHESSGADIADRGFGPVRDFLTDASRYDNIVTNPPFNLAEAFTLHALAQCAGKVCVLQRTAWLEGMARYKALFRKGHLHRVWVFSQRVSMPPGGTDIPARGGSIPFAWFVFGQEQRTAEIAWIDRCPDAEQRLLDHLTR